MVLPTDDDADWALRERRRTGDRIRDLRKRRQLSQEELAVRAGVSRKTISRMELGATASDIDQLNHVARALGVGTWRLFHD
nr:helix-turn-helix transcriptional regulator [Streptomyces sp. TLI_235]